MPLEKYLESTRDAPLPSLIDTLLNATRHTEFKRVRFFRRKIIQRMQLSKLLIREATDRMRELRRKQEPFKRKRIQGGDWLSERTKFDFHRLENSFEPQINSVDKRMQDEIASSFKDISAWEQELLEAELKLEKTESHNALLQPKMYQ